MAGIELIRDNLVTFRRLRLGLSVLDVSKIPETLLMKDNDAKCLSPWGDLVFNQAIDEIYSEKVWPSFSEKLDFGERFERSIRGLPTDRVKIINEKIDTLVRYLETERKDCLKSLDLKDIKGKPHPPSTHEIDAWSDKDAQRLFGHYVDENFILDKLDKKF